MLFSVYIACLFWRSHTNLSRQFEMRLKLQLEVDVNLHLVRRVDTLLYGTCSSLHDNVLTEYTKSEIYRVFNEISIQTINRI
jgi:hypothetical protein